MPLRYKIYLRKALHQKRSKAAANYSRDGDPAEDAKRIGKQLVAVNLLGKMDCNASKPLLPLRVRVGSWNCERKISLKNLVGAVEQN